MTISHMTTHPKSGKFLREIVVVGPYVDPKSDFLVVKRGVKVDFSDSPHPLHLDA